jgi:hypothetical protein
MKHIKTTTNTQEDAIIVYKTKFSYSLLDIKQSPVSQCVLFEYLAQKLSIILCSFNKVFDELNIGGRLLSE